jgi:hypothetical protein
VPVAPVRNTGKTNIETSMETTISHKAAILGIATFIWIPPLVQDLQILQRPELPGFPNAEYRAVRLYDYAY